MHPDQYAVAKTNAKIVAKQLGISEQEAERRIVAEMLRNSDKQTAQASGAQRQRDDASPQAGITGAITTRRHQRAAVQNKFDKEIAKK
ncbi:hypothetical protein [Burkholderia latens]|uniref:hypothetical protein n=1 Tax=Burkholderia latens TaxID=488446 RepID=UPI0012E3F9C2|nr:hypothetical protein [Burkholderia latens]